MRFDLDSIWILWVSIWLLSGFHGIRTWVLLGSYVIRFELLLDPMGFDLHSTWVV